MRWAVPVSVGVGAPLGDEEVAEAIGVEQRFGLADPTAHLHRVEAGPCRLLGPDTSTLLHEVVDPPPLEELRLGPHRIGFGQLVDRDLDRDVLGARRNEVVVATLVAAIRAQPNRATVARRASR